MSEDMAAHLDRIVKEAQANADMAFRILPHLIVPPHDETARLLAELAEAVRKLAEERK